MISIRTITHPTDFSDLSSKAFAHALAIALAARSRLHIVHVDRYASGALAFPHVRHLLVQWGLAEPDDPPSAISDALGVEIDNVRLTGQEATPAIIAYLHGHPSDLVVLGTHGREGIEHLLKGSVSETIFRRNPVPSLFTAPGTRGFVDPVTGDVRLKRVLVPVDFSPMPGRAIVAAQRFGRLLAGADPVLHLLHVGSRAPALHPTETHASTWPPVMLRSGNVVRSIVDAAIEFEVDLIGMPTAGHHGVFDALRGSTTERLIRHAPCPVLAFPTT
jgi:nucleotide-binding universal stress UspA family protein